MRKNRKFGLALVLGCLLAALVLVPGVDKTAEARPKFPKLFADEYTELKDKVRDAKCTVCHPNDKDKKIRNAYAGDLAKHIGDGDNWKDDDKVKEALKKAEKDKSPYAEGKTWGEIIKAGELPNGDNGDNTK